jgi:hypothetical protein
LQPFLKPGSSVSGQRSAVSGQRSAVSGWNLEFGIWNSIIPELKP